MKVIPAVGRHPVATSGIGEVRFLPTRVLDAFTRSGAGIGR
jgi:hypothetical protein